MYAFLRCNYTCFAVLFFSEKCVIQIYEFLFGDLGINDFMTFCGSIYDDYL